MLKKAAITALEKLEEAGYEAYIVGGAVRDLLLKKPINDYDITTNALPEEIKNIFETYPLFSTNQKYGTITVLLENEKIEITTYRKETIYKKHRKPTDVVFVTSLLEDCKRRDFTINALCLDKDLKIIDFFNGQKDLENKTLKAIGDPDERFIEDALRILRAIRFGCQLNFQIEEKTNEALFRNKDLLKELSFQRKKDELLKIIVCLKARQYLNDYKIIFNTFLDFEKCGPLLNEFNDLYQKMAYLINDGHNDLKQLAFNKNERILINNYLKSTHITSEDELIELLASGDCVKLLEYLTIFNQKDYTTFLKENKKYIVNQKELALTSYDLIEMGYDKKELGSIKKQLLKAIWQKSCPNNKVDLQNYLSKMI